MFSALQWPYRETRDDGFWGTQTSTLNWCEEDYNMTPYIAEFFNTVTNLIFIHLGVMGIRDCVRYGAANIYILSYLGYIVVGLGSMAFHATLKYSMQLADELPMIYTTCIMAYATFSYGKSTTAKSLIGLSLIGLAAWITAYYLLSQDPVFHQVAYATLTCAVVFRGMYVMATSLGPALKARNPRLGEEIMSQMWRMAFTGIALFLIGFSIWLFDNAFCRYLRSARNTILLPWAALLEGHGWWHIFTGLGAYYFIIWRVWLERCLDGKENDFLLDWPSPYWSVPRVIPRQGHVVNGNGHTNGNGKTVGNGKRSEHSNGNGKANGHSNGKDHKKTL